jgi:hypothetical protein
MNDSGQLWKEVIKTIAQEDEVGVILKDRIVSNHLPCLNHSTCLNLLTVT